MIAWALAAWLALAPCAPAVATAGGPIDGALALARRGRYDESLGRLDAIGRAGGPNATEARLEQGRLLERLGRRDEAFTLFSAIVSDYNAARPSDSASLVWAGAAGGHTRSSQQAIRLLDRAQKADPGNVRAFVESGRMFAETRQFDDARRELKRALELSPDEPDALVWLARVAFDDYRHADVKKLAGRLAKRSPDRTEARLLMARILLLEDEGLRNARAEIDAALAVNPREPEALALLAAHEYLTGAHESFEAAARRALAVNPVCAPAYAEAGAILKRSRRRREAEALYRRALEVDGEHVESLAALGQICLDEGREAEGRELLERATRLDRFRPREVNLLKALDIVDDEFVHAGMGEWLMRLHPARDAALLERLGPLVASCMADLGAAPGFSAGAMTPPTSLLIEVLPEQKWFGARLIGMPFHGPVGACLGPLLLLDSPRLLGSGPGFRAVVTHELAHAHHLAATEGRVPNWFTEGLATFQEGSDRPLAWDRLLARADRMGELLAFGELNRGFLSPRSPGEWALAYTQAELAIEYLVQRYGPLAPGRLLEAYGRGGRGPAAIERALGAPASEVASGVAAYWRSEVEALAVPPLYESRDIPMLEARFRKSGRCEEGAELARAYLHARDGEGCSRVLAGIGESVKPCGRVRSVAGELALAEGRPGRAVEFLDGSDAQDVWSRALLAKALERTGRLERAEAIAKDVAARHPRSETALEVLAAAARKRGDEADLIDSLEALTRLNPGEVEWRVERAGLALRAGETERAIELLEKAAEGDPGDPELNRVLGEALAARGDGIGARRAYRNMAAGRWLAAIDGTVPATTVQRLAEEAGRAEDWKAQGAADALSLVDGAAARKALAGLAASGPAEVRHRAALGLGRRGDGSAASILVDAVACSGCSTEAEEVLGGLAARGPEGGAAGWRAWWGENSRGEPREWLEKALAAAGYPAGPESKSGTGRQALLLLALEDERWYLRMGAWLELVYSTGRQFGRGAFGRANGGSPAMGRARRESIARWKFFFKEGR